MKRVRVAALFAALSVLAAAPASVAQMAREQSWTAYDTGSSEFNIAVAIGRYRCSGPMTAESCVPAGR